MTNNDGTGTNDEDGLNVGTLGQFGSIFQLSMKNNAVCYINISLKENLINIKKSKSVKQIRGCHLLGGLHFDDRSMGEPAPCTGVTHPCKNLTADKSSFSLGAACRQ